MRRCIPKLAAVEKVAIDQERRRFTQPADFLKKCPLRKTRILSAEEEPGAPIRRRSMLTRADVLKRYGLPDAATFEIESQQYAQQTLRARVTHTTGSVSMSMGHLSSLAHEIDPIDAGLARQIRTFLKSEGVELDMDANRERNARAVANKYAKVPEGSMVTYGLIGVGLLGMALWLIARFYDLNLLLHPLFLGAGGVAAFVGGVVLQRKRKRQHDAAFWSEYQRQGD